MRALLGILLSILLLQSQVFALSGGPDYNRGGGIASITGTYGGVMVEQCNCDGTSIGGSVGVYTLEIAQRSTSTGTILIFNSGRVYTGTITGIGDTSGSKGSTFKAIIEASFNYTLTTIGQGPTGGDIILTQLVRTTTNGILDTKIDTFRNGPVSNTLMTGTATLQVSNGFVDNDGTLVITKEIIYDVSGYRQALPAA